MQTQLAGDDMARLKALFDCNILDTPREEVFDQVTKLAAHLCGTPISLIGFIDANRQWFKSAVGWDASEIPREQAFCSQTLQKRSLVLVEDATKDRRFANNPLVAHPGIRFYAGAPLLTPRGYALGTLCVMDTVPRALPEEHKNALLALANLVAAQLETRRKAPRALPSPQLNQNELLFDHNVVGFFRSQADGHLLDCNTTFARILGYSSREEVLQRDASDFYFSPNDRASFLEKLREQKGLFNFECRLRKKDGSAVWVLENVFIAFGTGGAATMLEGTMVDVSEHKRTQQALQDSQERLQGIISSAMDAIITVDGKQRIVVFNRAAEAVFGCPASEALGQPISKFIPERFCEAYGQHIREFGRTGVPIQSEGSPSMLMGIRSNGEEFPIEATISQTKTANEKLYTVILRDISVRKRAEDDLRQAQKMEALGQLAGGIAHEFNNYLSVILGVSDLLETKAGGDEPLGRELAEIKNATQRAASLTRRLLAFSRKQVIEPSVLDLNAAIWETHKLLRRLIPANIDVIPVLHPDLCKVKVDPVQIQQILLNLVINARDAMPQGGIVTIETSEVELDHGLASRHLEVQPGKYVMLSVSDTGQGMDVETASHIFEVFFTTKTQGKGTGLGLSTTHGIVEQSGGCITVESAIGKGTIFRIYLPLIPTAIEEPSVLPPTVTAPGGTETILVVEDDTALRRLLCRSLDIHGYKVFAAKDGAEAIDLFQQHESQIHLVVSDIIMPHVDGFELKQRLTALYPDVKFLFMSGYPEEVFEHRRALLQGCVFLQKPFHSDELADKVRIALSDEAAA